MSSSGQYLCILINGFVKLHDLYARDERGRGDYIKCSWGECVAVLMTTLHCDAMFPLYRTTTENYVCFYKDESTIFEK